MHLCAKIPQFIQQSFNRCTVNWSRRITLHKTINHFNSKYKMKRTLFLKFYTRHWRAFYFVFTVLLPIQELCSRAQLPTTIPLLRLAFTHFAKRFPYFRIYWAAVKYFGANRHIGIQFQLAFIIPWCLWCSWSQRELCVNWRWIVFTYIPNSSCTDPRIIRSNPWTSIDWFKGLRLPVVIVVPVTRE